MGGAVLVFGAVVHVVYDPGLDGACGGDELEAELLLNGGEEGWGGILGGLASGGGGGAFRGPFENKKLAYGALAGRTPGRSFVLQWNVGQGRVPRVLVFAARERGVTTGAAMPMISER